MELLINWPINKKIFKCILDAALILVYVISSQRRRHVWERLQIATMLQFLRQTYIWYVISCYNVAKTRKKKKREKPLTSSIGIMFATQTLKKQNIMASMTVTIRKAIPVDALWNVKFNMLNITNGCIMDSKFYKLML